jgi:hypothetical protein
MDGIGPIECTKQNKNTLKDKWKSKMIGRVKNQAPTLKPTQDLKNEKMKRLDERKVKHPPLNQHKTSNVHNANQKPSKKI